MALPTHRIVWWNDYMGDIVRFAGRMYAFSHKLDIEGQVRWVYVPQTV